jgi:hypothetical protein
MRASRVGQKVGDFRKFGEFGRLIWGAAWGLTYRPMNLGVSSLFAANSKVI